MLHFVKIDITIILGVQGELFCSLVRVILYGRDMIHENSMAKVNTLLTLYLKSYSDNDT